MYFFNGREVNLNVVTTQQLPFAHVGSCSIKKKMQSLTAQWLLKMSAKIADQWAAMPSFSKVSVLIHLY